MSEDSLKSLNNVCCFFNLTMFGTLVVSSFYVLYKIKLDIDRPALFTLCVYAFSSLLQTVTWIQYLYTGRTPEDESVGNIIFLFIQVLSSILIWLILYFFIYELKLIQVKLEGKSVAQMTRELKLVKCERMFIIITATLLTSCILVSQIADIIIQKN